MKNQGENKEIMKKLERIEDFISRKQENGFNEYNETFRKEFIELDKYIFEFNWNFYVMMADLIFLSFMFLLAWLGYLPQEKLAFSGLSIVILNVVLQGAKSAKLAEKRSTDWNLLGKKIRILGPSKSKKWKEDMINTISKPKKNNLETDSSKKKKNMN